MHRFNQLVAVVTLAIPLFVGCAKQTAVPQEKRGEIAIPFTLTEQNNIVVSVLLNDSDTMNLMLHTAVSDVRVTEDAVRKSKSLRLTNAKKVQSWGGEADSRFSSGNRVQIGDLRRDNITVWEDKNSGKDTGGKFGLDFFEKQIIEIDFDRRCIAIHESLPDKVEQYERLKIDDQNGLLLIQGSCQIEGKALTNKFLLHSGYSGGILLDDAFAAKAGVDGKIKITEESSLKDSFGNTIKVKKGTLPVFALGGSQISDVPVGFFAGGLGNQKMSVMGCEILKRFNFIFDLPNHALYVTQRRKSVGE